MNVNLNCLAYILLDSKKPVEKEFGPKEKLVASTRPVSKIMSTKPCSS
jgi:hypothetical protein